MKYILFYVIPLFLYAALNNWAASFNWLLFLLLFVGFLMFQFTRLQYPKNRIPQSAKVSQAAFFVLTIALILRDRFLDATIVNGLLVFTSLLIIIHFSMSRRQPSA